MHRTRTAFLLASPLLAILLPAAPVLAVVYCADADRYIEHSTSQDREEVLRRVVALCPRHAGALNNLAVVLEGRGELGEAEELYRRAISADPDTIAPHAGLGDVLAARRDPAGAATAYEEFLAALDRGRATEAGRELARHESTYRDRLAAARKAAGLVTGKAPIGKVVTANDILKSLTAPPVRTRGLGIAVRTEPHIDIRVRFDFDSARLRPEAEAQLDEVAQALASTALADRRILIEGHTDGTGTDGYNLALSEARATAVRAALKRRGIAPGRMDVAGFGETRPIATNESADGRSINRRVTFVNAGPR